MTTEEHAVALVDSGHDDAAQTAGFPGFRKLEVIQRRRFEHMINEARKEYQYSLKSDTAHIKYMKKQEQKDKAIAKRRYDMMANRIKDWRAGTYLHDKMDREELVAVSRAKQQRLDKLIATEEKQEDDYEQARYLCKCHLEFMGRRHQRQVEERERKAAETEKRMEEKMKAAERRRKEAVQRKLEEEAARAEMTAWRMEKVAETKIKQDQEAEVARLKFAEDMERKHKRREILLDESHQKSLAEAGAKKKVFANKLSMVRKKKEELSGKLVEQEANHEAKIQKLQEERREKISAWREKEDERIARARQKLLREEEERLAQAAQLELDKPKPEAVENADWMNELSNAKKRYLSLKHKYQTLASKMFLNKRFLAKPPKYDTTEEDERKKQEEEAQKQMSPTDLMNARFAAMLEAQEKEKKEAEAKKKKEEAKAAAEAAKAASEAARAEGGGAEADADDGKDGGKGKFGKDAKGKDGKDAKGKDKKAEEKKKPTKPVAPKKRTAAPKKFAPLLPQPDDLNDKMNQKGRPAPHLEAHQQVKDLPSDQKRKLFGRSYRKMRCGLCEQDFAVENLPRRVTKSRIFKLRATWVKQTDDPELLSNSAYLTGNDYDKVPLCALCFEFVRHHVENEKICEEVL